MIARRLAAGLVLAATALTVTLTVQHRAAPAPRTRTAVAAPAGTAPAVTSPTVAAPNSADLMFAQMMIAHHEQAVRMSQAVLGKTGVPERTTDIARFIVRDQQREIDAMTDWLAAWGQAPTGGHDHMGPGPGMLTEAQLHRLDTATGPQATTMYLSDMIEHHRGAIAMARRLLDGTGRNVFTHGVAKHVINEQTAEVDAMRALLPTRSSQ
ncbi:DUF305 domain-containing protein [Actinoplanes sp. N902-109]|uniref:DUF305 domain-containing protein n=1 Tax=Actinoplanes sp. (strain N902-109) TaxID=649831 RepID=UPI0003295698|nr:DUF305 domain-containing protein [Actinoplanes sp. N902-109]AGL16820.1 hypothetical protein L083_3310 [Actinoplanes sp. N902-109]